jgi:two-component system sensor kinase FixL
MQNINQRRRPISLAPGDAAPTRQYDWRALRAALAVGVVYYAGAKVGMALTIAPLPISVLWPPNALLFAALLLAPRQWWWILILGAFPAHLLAELQSAVPLTMVLGWFCSNVAEALVGAALVQRFAGKLSGLSTVRAVAVFCAAAALAPFLSSFLDAGLVRLLGWSTADYWALWKTRFFSNMLATLTFVPVAITWAAADPLQLHVSGRARMLEAVTLLAGLLAVSTVAFDVNIGNGDNWPSLLYLPMPFLVWAALRFGPALTSAAFTLVALLVIWGAAHGRGPFQAAATHDHALPIQLFLITIAVPLLLLAAVIEERRRAEQKLRSSEELFASAFHCSPDAIAISRQEDGHILEANERWLDFLGHAHDGTASARSTPLERHLDDAGRATLLARMRGKSDVHAHEVTLRDRSGNTRQALVSVTAVAIQGQPCLISIARDVTDQRNAELEAREQSKQLTHLTRVASLTDFSGTLAHELNQPLTAILSNAQAALRFLARDPPDMTEIRSILGEIAEADKRAGLLIHHLRLLMKKGEEEFAQIDLNHLVQDVLTLVHGEFAVRSVDLSPSFSPDLPPINGDRVQLQQLVLNLVSNALEAMQGQERSRRTLSVATMHGPGDSVQVVVGDSGSGIRPDQFERIFEPFFTTKENGLGLGLAICRKIARAHGGTLAAENRQGGGTSMRLVLPAAPPPGQQ